MSTEKRVYKESFVTMLESVKGRASPRVFERIRNETGVDPNASTPSYPLEAHDKVIQVLCEELYRGRSMEDATYELGRGLMSNYGNGVLGRAMFSVIRLIGPMRVLKRVPEFFRQANNYVEVKLEVTGPTSYVLEHNELGSWPHYTRGTMQGAGDLISLPGHSVELLEYDGHRGRFNVSWTQ